MRETKKFSLERRIQMANKNNNTLTSGKQVVFKELTINSISSIREKIANEKARIEIEKAGEDLDENPNTKKSKKQKNAAKSSPKVPDKDFELGQKLSRKYQQLFPKELFGKPIEEVDEFYKCEYVSICKCQI